MAAASRNIRGSNIDRYRRRQWLISQVGITNTNGEKTRVPCHHCGRVMRATSKWHVDRHPVCGHNGGRYVRGNIAVSCVYCNTTKCGNAHVECRAVRP